jgi:hypothetical protein
MRKKARRTDGTDPQCDQLYSWETAHEHFNVCTLKLEECDQLINAALKRAGHKPVAVYQGQSNAYSWCMPRLRRIAMQGPSKRGRGGMNVATCLHEAAHQICFDRHGERAQDHGPMFLAIYRKLLLDAKVMTAKEFCLTALNYKLRWNRNAAL